MSERRVVGSFAVALVLVAPALTAQQRDDVPLATWSAPPYWMPPVQAARDTAESDLAAVEGATLEPLALPTAPLPFIGITPCRLIDTRGPIGTYGGPALVAGSPRSFPVAGQCGVAADAGAVSVNATVTNTQGAGFVALYPEGSSFPGVSNVNYTGASQTVANAAVVPLGPGGFTAIAGVSGTDLIVDINGYYAPLSAVTSLNTLTGAVTLAQGANITISPSGNTLTIAASGGTLPTGTAGQTLRNDGTSWVAASNLSNDGTNVGIGTTTPGQNLSVAGTLGILGGSSYSIFQGAPGQAANLTYLLPATSANGVLRNTSGALSWDTSPAPVTSVFGRTGAITATSGDYTATQVTNTPAGTIAAATVQAALNELDTEKSVTGHTHTSTGVTGLTSGGMLFGNSSGNLGQSASSLFWDQTNGRLGVGTAAPSALFELKGSGTQAAALLIDPYNTASGNTGELRFAELAAGGTNYVALKAPDALSASTVYTLPATSADGMLKNTSGVLSWDSSSGPVTSVFGRTGEVTATSGDYTATLVTNTPAGTISSTTVQAALNELDTEKSATSHTHTATTITGLTAGGITFGSATGTLTQAPNLFWNEGAVALNVVGSVEVGGLLRLAPTSSTGGQLQVNGVRFLHAYGSQDTFVGEAAGNLTTTGNSNTGVGYYALNAVTSGTDNTGVGIHALTALTTGTHNSAFGRGTLLSNTIGSDNTAVGRGALTNNTTASRSTALGAMALQTQSYSNGGAAYYPENTAVGYQALQLNQPTSATNGTQNTAVGANAMLSNTIGSRNTATGHGALYSNTVGDENAALGVGALYSNSTANRNTSVGYDALSTQSYSNGGVAWNSENTAVGYEALAANQPTSTTNGYQNTAVGAYALQANTIGYFNVATGHGALAANTVGKRNVAVGRGALNASTTTDDNTAVGDYALGSSVDGHEDTAIGAGALRSQGDVPYWTENTAVGFNSLYSNLEGIYNTALGHRALYANTTGGRNVAVGWGALDQSNGSYNTAIGIGAGSGLESGDYNVYLASDLPLGSSSESSTIRIGDPDEQTRAFLAGVYGVTVTGGTAVYVKSDGQLGTVTSSRRYKRDIEDVGERSEVLRQLRPVRFRYTEDRDPAGEQQYGLIAEEVEEVAPELVVHGEDGRPETVRYELVNALLLDEVLRQRKEIDELREVVRALVEVRRAVR